MRPPAPLRRQNRLFSDAQLTALASASSALRCECHNASSRNARLQQMLRLASGHARGMIEEALQLLEAEQAMQR